MAHSRRFAPRRSSSMKTWFGQTVPAIGVDITPASLAFSAGNKFFGTPFQTDVTILRTRGSAVFLQDASAGGTIGDTLAVAVGIGLVTAEAAAAGAVPLPYDNPDWDGWFYYETHGFEAYTTGLSGSTNGLRANWTIDTKAMRKIQGGMVLALATQLVGGTAVNTGIGVDSIISIRALLKTS